MLNLLLDEQISPEVGELLRARQPMVAVQALSEWENGTFLGASDEMALEEASRRKLTLVTYDLRTIPPLLKRWAESGKDHAGVIFVDHKTIPSSDFGGLAAALRRLAAECAKWDWTNRILFLRRS